jgi:5-formyltetrahydrofolate cyclo-ligase
MTSEAAAPLPPPHPTDAKVRWRAWARAERRRLANDALASARAWSQAGAHLAAWPTWAHARWALVYLPFGDEPDPLGLAPVTAAPHATGTGPATTGRPRLAATRTPPDSDLLSVHALHPRVLERHPFGFAQPHASAVPVPVDQIDVVLVPGLCFDRRGGRLGYGRGLYDRLLAGLPREVVTVGVARDALVVAALPLEPHDVDVQWLLTERGLQRTRPRPGPGDDVGTS